MLQTDDQIDARRSGDASPSPGRPNSQIPATEPLRVGLFYDMDACHSPTGVTRHALAQLERLMRRPEIALRVLTGRISLRDGVAYWESLQSPIPAGITASALATFSAGGVSRRGRPSSGGRARSSGSIVRPSSSCPPGKPSWPSPAMTCCRRFSSSRSEGAIVWAERLRSSRLDSLGLSI